MTKAFEKIRRGLDEARVHAWGERSAFQRHEVLPLDVKAARKRLGMTQEGFSRAFGVSLDTLRKWETGARRPTGAARTLLRVIEHNPEAVAAAIRDKAA
jgi:putative transcriptional regulator